LKAIDALLPVALLGTARAGDVPSVLRAIGGAAGELLEAVAADAAADPPVKVLRSAGVLTQCQRVAFVAEPAGSDEEPEPDLTSDAAALPEADWAAHIERLVSDGPFTLQQELMRIVAERGWRIPARTLPATLNLAASEPRLRTVIASAIGVRGRWLAGRRARWRDAIGPPASPTDDDWSHGGIAARAAFLRSERLRDPDAARERLRAELPQLGADERAKLVACLAVRLSPADEPLLDALLVDRAADVRRTAAGLFARLPESARARAIGEALAALLVRTNNGTWSIEAPEAEHPRAKALGLEPRPKSDTLGERAWRAYQLARNAPLSFWTAHTGMTPHETVQWAAASDWSQSLLRGMHDALLGAPETAWVAALLDGWQPKILGPSRAHVQALLPWSQQERLWTARLDRDAASGLAVIVTEVAQAAGPNQRLSAHLAERLAQFLAGTIGTMRSPIGPLEREAALATVAAMPDSALEKLRVVSRAEGLPDALAESVDAIERFADLRLRLRALAPAPATLPDPRNP
jgi:hypothetical protein